jgi:hypothetical protein
LQSISASIEGSLPENTARWQASLRSIKPRPNYDRGSICGDIEQTTVSFGFPAVCHDRFNYWLDGPIDLHCRVSGLFESIDRLFDIAALLSFWFRVFAFHFSSIFVVLARHRFLRCFFPFFAFFAAEAKQ